MKVYYVVLYVKDGEASLKFWTEKAGMAAKGTKEVGGYKIHKVGFADQDFAFELVPLDLMKNNPDNLNLGTPSICFAASDLPEFRNKLIKNGVQTTEIADHFGFESFAFSDNDGSWFAAMKQ